MSTSSTKSRPTSVSTSASASSLMQDVPGAFPPTPNPRHEDSYEDEEGEQEVTFKSLSQAVHARRAEYVRPKHVRIKVGTWNVAAFKGTDKDVGGWFVGGKGVADKLSGVDADQHGQVENVPEQEARYKRKHETIPRNDGGVLPAGKDVGLYVLGLQEIIDITAVGEALKPYTDPGVANRWKESVAKSLPPGYVLVAEQQLLGLLLLVFASPEVSKDVKAVSTTSVGTGVFGYMGNKGAVTARIVLGDTTRLVFVNSHLAAGADKTSLERRIWDAEQIVTRTKFEPIQDAMDLAQTSGESIGDADFAFWFGDLNFRLEGIPGDDVRRLLMLHTRNQYDLSQASAKKVEDEIRQATDSVNKRLSMDETPAARASSDTSRHDTLIDEIHASEDPTSLQTTLDSLLPHDELRQQMNKRKAFHDGWQEGPITFLPTYKYDAGSVGVFDSSEKKRAPSWCDRILYRTRREKLAYDAKIREEENARKKDEEMRSSGIDQAAQDEDVLYSYDPDTDGGDYDEYDEYDDAAAHDENVVVTKEGFIDEITLEYYTAHQRVLSSDHKPLDAGFMLKYDAVVPELKAKVHAEVARELDKAENEGRPNVTVVVDKQTHTAPAESTDNLPGGRSDEGVWFGDVRWAQSKHRSVTVANTSRVPATFSFIERPVDSTQTAGIAPHWLAIKINDMAVPSADTVSQAFTLEPGDTALVELDLKITNMDDVRHLNDSSKNDIEDILVLRVENGRDHFIPIRGHWLESSLARTIDTLIRIPEGGIRKLQRQKPSDSGREKVKKAADAVSATNAFAGGDASRNASIESTSSGKDQLPPVRFSAPRELFRLTEAVEELMTRVVAEWEMINAPPTTPRTSSESQTPSIDAFVMAEAPPPTAPWEQYPAWPFDELCWTERQTTHWEEALSAACNSLDEDLPLERDLPDDLPRIQRLYVLCSLLLIFLQNIPDGIITTHLWTQIETYLLENEKQKRKPSTEDVKTCISEILAQEPSHNISFILITSMLERITAELASGSDLPSSPVPAPPPQPPLSPGKKAVVGGIKRIATFSKKDSNTSVPLPLEAREKLATKALAEVFAKVVVRSGDGVVGMKKNKNLVERERRKVEVLEVFLRRGEPG